MTAILRADPAHIERALRLILEPGQVTELRAFEGKRPLCIGYFDTDHIPALAVAAARLESASGVYFIPNVIKPALLARAANRTKRAGETEATKDHDIDRRRWLLVDCDPKRPAGISSTDGEHEAALDRCRAIRARLRELGWPDPVFADSGNGGHLLYRVDLPAEDGGLVERILAALVASWTDPVVDVDRTVKNPSRVWKLYGTVARKGDATEDRPYRLSRVLNAPDAPIPVPLELLEALAASVGSTPKAAVVLPSPAPSPSPRLQGAARETESERNMKRARAYLEKMEPAIEGQGGDATTFRMCSCLRRDFGLDVEDALSVARGWNARCTPPWGDDELRKKLENAGKYGKKGEGFRASEEAPKAKRSKPAPKTAVAEDHECMSEPLPGFDQAPEADDLEDADPCSAAWPLLATRMTDGGAKLQRWGGNLAKILRHDTRWGSRLALDEMTQDILFDESPIDETFADIVQEKVEDTYKASFGAEEILRKLRSQAQQHSIHPVREYLKGLPPWDEVERLFHIPEDVLGTVDDLSPYYFRHWAIGAVRRVFSPGCKFDVALTLVGLQGKGKSTFWSILGGEWFSDTPVDLDSKDRFQQLAAAWIVELPEIDWQTYNKTAEALKAFLSSREDRFRPPYGKSVMTVRRTSVCVGSTNKEEFLTDPTGSRRFWPVMCPRGGVINLDYLRSVRDQVWAEALHYMNQGLPHWLPDDLEARRSVQAERFTVEDSWGDLSERALDKLKLERIREAGSVSDGFTTAEIMLEMGLPAHQHSSRSTTRVRDLLRGQGWVCHQVQIRGDRRWRWCPPA